MKLYKGDANRGTFRTTQSIFVIPQTQRDNNFVPETGATRNYGRGSGVNGANLSSFPLTGDIYRGAYGGTDEDGVADDCRLWNQRGQADKNGMQGHSVSYLTANSVSVNLYGSARDPLEPSSGLDGIKWNMYVNIDDVSQSAFVSYTHTCYPAHIVKVNGVVVYSYLPPRNDRLYLLACLSNLIPQESGTSPVTRNIPPPLNGTLETLKNMIRKMLLCFLFSVALSHADVTQLKQRLEGYLTQPAGRLLPTPDEVLSQLDQESMDVLSTEDVNSLLALAKRCLRSAQLEVRRDGMLLILAVAGRPDSSKLLDSCLEDLEPLLSDPASPLRQGAIAVLVLARPKASTLVIAAVAAHLEDKGNSPSETTTISAFLLQALPDDPGMVHRVLSAIRKRSDAGPTIGVLQQLGLIKTRNPEALTFIGASLASANRFHREAAVEAVSRLDRVNRLKFAAQLGRIAEDNSEPEQVRLQAVESLR